MSKVIPSMDIAAEKLWVAATDEVMYFHILIAKYEPRFELYLRPTKVLCCSNM